MPILLLHFETEEMMDCWSNESDSEISVIMNDLLTLESDESGQENKFQLHMSVKNEITVEDVLLDSMPQPVTCDAGPMTTMSVGSTALSDGANSTNRILQVRSYIITCVYICLSEYYWNMFLLRWY